MRYSTTTLLSFLVFLLLSTACRRENIAVKDALPPITQEGLNTFGCKINGEVLVPKDGKGSLFVGGAKGLRSALAVVSEEKKYYYIQAVNAEYIGGDYIFLYLPNLKSAGRYVLGNSIGSTLWENNSPNHAIVTSYDEFDNGESYLSFENGGSIVVDRYDTINFIISGTFQFRAIKESDPFSDTLSVTEGRFDINWKKLNEERL